MKHLEINSAHFNWLLGNFKEWLDIIGYAERTVEGSPVQIRELLNHLEQKNIRHITLVKARHISDFLRHLKLRSNLKHGGALSASSINSYITALNLFARYLNQTGKHILDINPRQVENDVNERTVL
ncbi:MAG TPA: phage integrase N-terminal SAM-like domain-containing protein, partial [Bacteroidia bacterium]